MSDFYRCAHYSRGHTNVQVFPYPRPLLKEAKCSKGYTIHGNMVVDYNIDDSSLGLLGDVSSAENRVPPFVISCHSEDASVHAPLG